MVGQPECHVKKSKYLADDLTKLTIEDGNIFNSHDVVSLFYKITPIDKTLEIIRDRLENHKTLKQRTKLDVDDIMEL